MKSKANVSVIKTPADLQKSFEGPPKRGVGRPPGGKRSDPNYRLIGAWIRRDTYNEMRKKLIDEDKEISVLIQELVEDWLKASK
jgi:hypothetical protein